MGASSDLQLIAKLVDTGEIRKVLDAGINKDLFRPRSEAAHAFEWILSYWRDRQTSGNVPTRKMLKAKFPGVHLPQEDRLGIESAIEALLTDTLRQSLQDLSTQIVDDVNDGKDPRQVMPYIFRRIHDLAAMSHRSTDLVLAKQAEESIAAYERMKNRSTCLTGVPWPWDILNDETLGIQNGEFIVLFGRPKSMKTWLLLYILVNAYYYANQRVLIYTREMPPEKIRDRCNCLIIGCPYDVFRKGLMHTIPVPEGGTMEDRFYEVMRQMDADEKACLKANGHHKGLIITSDREDRHGGGILGLKNKIETYQPDIIGVDGMYLMRDDREGKRSVKWDALTNITQDMHDLALDTKRPIIGTTQAKRDAENKTDSELSDISYSDSFGQDCDLGIRVIRRRSARPDQTELALVVAGAREFSMHGFAIHGCPANNFDQIMTERRDETGAILTDDEGNPLMEPVVYNDNIDLLSRWKEEREERTNKSNRARERTNEHMEEKRKRMNQHLGTS